MAWATKIKKIELWIEPIFKVLAQYHVQDGLPGCIGAYTLKIVHQRT